MFGSALPKLITLVTPLVLPAQIMSTSPQAKWSLREKAAVVQTAARGTSARAIVPASPTRPDERDLASLNIRLPEPLGAAVIPPAKPAATQPTTVAATKLAPEAPATSAAVTATAPAAADALRGLHVTGWVALLPKRMGELVDFIDKSHLNAVMICIKDEAGTLFWRMKTPGQDGPHSFSKLLSDLKKRGIKTACRFVCFKDAQLEKQNPEMRFDATPGEKRVPLWVDPSNPKVERHVLSLLEETAKLGFDEINLDYVRFPDRVKMTTPLGKKVDIISNFIRKARETVKPYNVRLTASVFGYVAWDEKKANVGQRIEDIYQHLDGVYFMLYPSHFAKGDLGFKDPSARPYEVVRLGMEAARRHFEKTPLDILPWIQVFSLKNDHRYGSREILQQLKGNEDAGIWGYWAWDPGCEYRALKEALPILAREGYPPVNEAYFTARAAEAAKKSGTQLAAKTSKAAKAATAANPASAQVAAAPAAEKTTSTARPAKTPAATKAKPAAAAAKGSPDQMYSY
ncbi:MAG: hypothetical protein HYY25_04020 [Candidatus Wallbacteria bacterium]|nr:hypothetical protein [Candidatus Wallbacteria bacterium]